MKIDKWKPVFTQANIVLCVAGRGWAFLPAPTQLQYNMSSPIEWHMKNSFYVIFRQISSNDLFYLFLQIST